MKREPFFGPNAKPFLIQLVFLIFCIIVAVPIINSFSRPYITAMVEGTSDFICSTTGWCTPEAAGRLNVPVHPTSPSE